MFWELLKQYRSSTNTTLRQLADDFNTNTNWKKIDSALLSRYENWVHSLSRERMQELFIYWFWLDLQKINLEFAKFLIYKWHRSLKDKTTHLVPVYNSLHDLIVQNKEDISDWWDISQQFSSYNKEDLVYSRVNIESMKPNICTDDYVLVHKTDNTLEDKKIYLITFGNRVYIYKIHKENDYIELIPYNRDLKIKIIQKKEIKDLNVIWRVLQVQRFL